MQLDCDKMAIPIEEGYVNVPGGRVWYKVVGVSDENPLLVLHGGPGSPHNYLNPLKKLASDRPVIFTINWGVVNQIDPTIPLFGRPIVL
jgi:proline iminopeptidase